MPSPRQNALILEFPPSCQQRVFQTTTPAPTLTNRYIEASLSGNTLRAYRADLAHFEAYCQAHDCAHMPASTETVVAYLVSTAAQYKWATLNRRLLSIKLAHKMAGHPIDGTAPDLRHTLRGIARVHGTAQRRAAALGTAEVRAMAATCPDTLTGTRDRAILLVGFAGAFRRSEITAIDVAHLTFQPDVLRILLPRSKADAEGKGVEVVILRGAECQTCPVRALQAWIDRSDTQAGPVFRGIDRWGHILPDRLHADGIRRIVKRAAADSGITVAAHEALSPHGLRVGFVTEAYRAGAREEDIMHHTRHTSAATMRLYVRRSNKMSDHPGRLLGL